MPVIALEEFEIKALIEWHREQQREYSKKGEYLEADYHKKRAEEISNRYFIPF